MSVPEQEIPFVYSQIYNRVQFIPTEFSLIVCLGGVVLEGFYICSKLCSLSHVANNNF